MDKTDIDLIDFWIEYWEDGGRVDDLLAGLPIEKLEQFIHHLPTAMRRDLAKVDFVRKPPKTIDDFLSFIVTTQGSIFSKV